MIGLTPKQRQLYDFIAAEIAAKGVAPSLQEMAGGLGLASKSNARANWNNSRLRRAGAEGSYKVADIRRISEQQSSRCAYCRTLLRRGQTHVDHITAIIKGGSNFPRNLQLLCRPCNQHKHAKDPIDFARSIGRLI